LNGGEVAAHFAAQGLRSTVPPADMHVTIVYSKQPLWWERVPDAPDTLLVPPGVRTVERLGPEGAIVLRFASDALRDRWQQYREAGASHDWNGFTPHVTVTYASEGVDPSKVKPFPGALRLGPEQRRPIEGDWKPRLDEEIPVADLLDKAIVARIPVLIKARPQETGGRRLVEVQASNEAEDWDGDCVLQEALVKGAAGFIASGHLDIDHMSEFGARMGIPDPASYVVGRPLEVKALSNRDTFVLGEISKSLDGTSDPARRQCDMFWESLQRDPPVAWFSSIYGFPTDMVDCSAGECPAGGPARFIIKSIDWRSLAFTRTPKNEALLGKARIVTAKSFMLELAKSLTPPVALPNTMDDVWNARSCPTCEVHKAPSLPGYRRHLALCKGYPSGVADVCAHALMHRHAMDRAIAA